MNTFLVSIASMFAEPLADPEGTPLARFEVDSGTISNWRWPAGLTLGGMGCGKLELGTDGSLGQLTLNNNWDSPIGWLRSGFFAIHTNVAGRPVARVLRLRREDEFTNVQNAAQSRFRGLFPQAWLEWPDPALPVKVSMHAWSPLAPNEILDSALPVAFFDFTLANPGEQSADVTIAASWPNVVGLSGRDPFEGDFPPEMDADALSREKKIGDWRGVEFTHRCLADGRERNHNGSQWLAVHAPDGAQVRAAALQEWSAHLNQLTWWESFATSGELKPAPGTTKDADASMARSLADRRSAGAVSATLSIGPKSTGKLRFMLAWHMPHLMMLETSNDPDAPLHQVKTDVPKAFDGKDDTRWTAGHPQRPGDSLTVVLAGPADVARLEFDSKQSPYDWPRGLAVEASPDAQHWRKAAEWDARTIEKRHQDNVFTLTLPAGACEPSTQFVRLRITGSVEKWYWSINELRLFDRDGERIALRVGACFTEVRGTLTERGHFYETRFPDLDALVAYTGERAGEFASRINRWQKPLIDSNLPAWLKYKLINDLFPSVSNTVFTRDGRWSVLESPVTMGGALGTMDQRMAAHAGWAMLWPDLDERELRAFADVQQPDGRISHFCGNVWDGLPKADVGYGITDWPDLSASFVAQVLKRYRWTGDRAFLNDMFPHVRRAMQFLKAADADGDEIPEGGSTYDYETVPRGAFIYNATCYLAALRCAEAMAQIMDEPHSAREYADQFVRTQAACLKYLRNGERFIKWRKGDGAQTNDNSFIASLAGDWLARSAGAPSVFPADVCNAEIMSLIDRHLLGFYSVPPMEVTDAGKAAVSATFILQHQPYLGSEAVYLNHVAAGLETHRRVFDLLWLRHHHPWSGLLGYTAEVGNEWALKHYMTHPASWHLLQALAGLNLDVPARTLYCSPRIGGEFDELHIPVYLGRVWFWLDCVPARRSLSLRVLWSALSDADIEQVRRDGDTSPVKLQRHWPLREGESIDLSSHWDRLMPPAATSLPEELSIADRAQWRTSVTRPEGQIVADAARAIVDGSLRTRWTTARPMKPGDAVSIRFPSPRMVASVTLHHARWPDDYPRGLRIEILESGGAWRRVADSTPEKPADGRLVTSFDACSAAAIRLTQTGESDRWWWSIGEVEIGGPAEKPIPHKLK